MPEDRDLIQSLCDLEIPSAIQLSPDCHTVLYSTELSWGHYKGTHAVSTLWLASTGQANSSRQLTSGSFKDYAPAWNPNGRSIAFISDRAKVGEQWAIYVLPLPQSGEAYPVTAEGNERAIEAFVFSPNGKHIAFLSPDEKTTEQVYREQNGEDMQIWGEEWAHTRLRVVNIETKGVTSLNMDRHVTDLCWSPDGKQIGIVSCTTPFLEDRFLYGSVISTVDLGSMAVKDLCKLSKADNTHLQWAGDGRLYFCTGVPVDKLECGHGVYAIDPSLDFPNHEKVAFGIDDDVDGLLKANGEIVAKVDRRLESCISLLSGKVLWCQEKALEAFDAVFTSNRDEIVLAVATSDVNHPVEVFSTTAGGSAVVQLSNHGQAFETRRFGTCRFLLCRSADNEVELDSIYLTPTSGATLTEGAVPAKPLPTVVMIHGGPNTRITNAFNTYYFMWTPYLLSLGYGVLLPNYRGSSGRGEKFASFSIDGVGNYDHADVISVTQNAIEKGYADRDKLLVAGWSQGGMLTFLCSVRNGLHNYGWRFNASIPGAGICDSDSMALTSDLGSVFQPEINNNRVAWNMSRDDTRNRRASPLWEFNEAIEQSKQRAMMVVPPMLILHGEKDERCPVAQSWGMRRALQSQGLPYEFVTYPRQGHVFKEQKFWIDMAARIGRWCDRYIGGESRKR